MKPESYAWLALHEHAAVMLRPGFAERTLRAAREIAPTFGSQIMLSAATVAVCLTAIFFVHTRQTANETARNLAGWEAIAMEVESLGSVR